ADGMVDGADTAAQARSAYERMLAGGWTEGALRAGVPSTRFDLWRAIAATSASAYGRYGVGGHPSSFSFAAQSANFRPRAATAAEQAAWWSDGSGIPPGAGVGLIDPQLAPPDFGYTGLRCLRALNAGVSADARRVQAGIAATRAGLPRAGLPVVV